MVGSGLGVGDGGISVSSGGSVGVTDGRLEVSTTLSTTPGPAGATSFKLQCALLSVANFTGVKHHSSNIMNNINKLRQC